MRKYLLIINAILLVVLLALDAAYIELGSRVWKACASATFVLIGLVNLFYAYKNKLNLKFPIIMVVGLIFAMLGDIVINIHFIAGAGLFAVGHVFFVIAYNTLYKFNWKDIVISLVIFIAALLFVLLAPIFEFSSAVMQVVVIVYALIISFMVGKTISNLIEKRNILNIVLVVGSVLFFSSDFCLLLNNFANLDANYIGTICLALYYPAEFLLAFSIFVYADINCLNKPKEVVELAE